MYTAFSQEATTQLGNPLQCLSNSLLDIGNVPPPETSQLQYYETVINSTEARPLRQVIIPQLQFSCHGIITSYSALTTLLTGTNFLSFLGYEISFAVWRPRGQGLYDLVGQNRLIFSGKPLQDGVSPIDNSTGLVSGNIEYFQFTNKEPQGGHISFQPGDVLGWNVEPNINSLSLVRPLSLVYRKAIAGEMQDAYDIFSVFSPKQPPNEPPITCSVSECDSRASNLSSIIPYFSVQYSKLNTIRTVMIVKLYSCRKSVCGTYLCLFHGNVLHSFYHHNHAWLVLTCT